MLLVEDALPILLEALQRMPARDRRAILAILTPAERERLARLKPGSAEPAGSTCSADVEVRLAALRAGGDGGMTPATGEALRRLLDITPASAGWVRKPQPAASLMDSLGGMLRRERRNS